MSEQDVLPKFDAIEVASFLGGVNEFAVLHSPENHNPVSQVRKASPEQKCFIKISASIAVLQGDLHWYNTESKNAGFNLHKATFKIHQGVAGINKALSDLNEHLAQSSPTAIDKPQIVKEIATLQNKFQLTIGMADAVVAEWPAELFDDSFVPGAAARIKNRTSKPSKHGRG